MMKVARDVVTWTMARETPNSTSSTGRAGNRMVSDIGPLMVMSASTKTSMRSERDSSMRLSRCPAASNCAAVQV